ncbi:hypothetical protein CIPAW_07G146200 [Carya illinoinensis]|uniref:Retrotransposon gag domain-containing protein n=1 Tax=Carya illinoinensis TaxID=32201 RepID=A0A8T1PZ62_CARIL|nr:hypothetical protein CIPAW_07G146200 [Carya illinoinensis]
MCDPCCHHPDASIFTYPYMGVGGVTGGIRAQGEQSREVQAGYTYEGFLVHRTPAFTGEDNPLQTGKWIRDLERTFEVCGCTKAQQVLYASYLLQGIAIEWWETKRKMLVSELGSFAAVSWQRFKKEFYDRKRITSLVQGSMTVEQYAWRFIELGRFPSHLIAKKEIQAKRFQEDLRPDIRRMIVCHRITSFQELVDLTTLAERENSLRVGSPPGQKRLNVDGE